MPTCTIKSALSLKDHGFWLVFHRNGKTDIHCIETNKTKVNCEYYMNLLDDGLFLTADVSKQKMISFSNRMELQVTQVMLHKNINVGKPLDPSKRDCELLGKGWGSYRTSV